MRDSLLPRQTGTARKSMLDLKAMLLKTKTDGSVKGSILTKKGQEKDSAKITNQQRTPPPDPLQTPKVADTGDAGAPAAHETPATPESLFLPNQPPSGSVSVPRTGLTPGVGSRSKMSQQSDLEESGSDVSFDLDHVYAEGLNEKREVRRQTLRNIRFQKEQAHPGDKVASKTGLASDKDSDHGRLDSYVTAAIGVFFVWVLIYRLFIWRLPTADLWYLAE